MNEHLPERFSRARRPKVDKTASGSRADVWILPQRLNTRIRDYYQGLPAEGGRWLSRPEIPSSDEILDLNTSNQSSGESDVLEIATNKPVGAWNTTEEYLETQYELLREDAVKPIRDAVSRVRITPAAVEEAFNGQIGIYEKVHICAVICSTRGIATRITFSLVRAGKKIIWEQSKRLLTGSLVVLTPKHDMFDTKAIVATVAARPLAGLQQNPPEIDLFFPNADELEIDPAVEYVMVEERSGFFEADRHTLTALQHMMKEKFPLSEHIVDAKSEVQIPQHIMENPKKDLRAAFTDNKHETYENVDVLKCWPNQVQSELDSSQLQALRSILTKRLAIVQGPPGTGKTHVSVKAIKVMLDNRQPDDPPIIIACQTNHAVDQILRHIAKFEPEGFVRLGGRSKDQDVIKKRTLYEVRMLKSENPPAGWAAGMARKKMKDLQTEVELILTPLKPNKKPLDHRVLENLTILTKAQADSLENGASKWVQAKKTNPNEARNPFSVWLNDKLVPVPAKREEEDFGFEYEEADLEFEQLKELEAENAAKDDEDFETLNGVVLTLGDNFTCRRVPGMDAKAKELLKQQDMWRIPEAGRAAVYRHLQTEMKKAIATAFRAKAKLYNEQAMQRRIGYWEKDETILKQQKVIGMTTTGFSKYRALLAALQPKVVLIEEAAETLEAPVTVACVPSLQQLILVGDHQQLRPHTHVKAHEDHPYYLNVSLFERLVNNRVDWDILSNQRRMIPEIRRILYPIYKDNITDHPSVLDKDSRPDVPGMGGVNSLFFTHRWPEQRDDQMSCYNRKEAEMIVGFVEHLAYNGLDAKDVTVLTFYNGQRKRILAELRNRPLLSHFKKFNVVTVDSYQGEENKVVLLSLVRSNANGEIGFLSVVNRICVALSRAQCGFYMFGNGGLLHDKCKTWASVMQIMAGTKQKKETPRLQPKRLVEEFPIRCSNHNNMVEIIEPEDWDLLMGGCMEKCGGVLPCGHSCTLICHPVSHENVICHECKPAPEPANANPYPAEVPRQSQTDAESRSVSAESWRSYASEEAKHMATLRDSYTPLAPQLLDLSDAGVSYDGASAPSTASTVKAATDRERVKNRETFVVEGEAEKKDCSKMNLLD